MRKAKLFSIILLFVFIVSAIGYASMTPPPIMNTDDLKVGTWAKFEQKENGTSFVIWLGIVGEEKVNGKRYVWLEARFNQKGQEIIAKVLTRIDVKENVSDIKKIVFKIGNQPAMEISPDMLKMMGTNIELFGSATPQEENAEIKVVGNEKIKVPAGTFTAKHIKIINKDNPSSIIHVWESSKVPIGIVKMKSPQGEEFILLAYGKGAKSKITETPQKLNMPNIMNMNKK